MRSWEHWRAPRVRSWRGQARDDEIYQRGDWLALRRELTPSSPALHRVREAESLLRPILRKGGPDALEVNQHLISLNMRMGKFRTALQVVESALRIAPAKPDLEKARELFRGLAEFPGDGEALAVGRPTRHDRRGKFGERAQGALLLGLWRGPVRDHGV